MVFFNYHFFKIDRNKCFSDLLFYLKSNEKNFIDNKNCLYIMITNLAMKTKFDKIKNFFKENENDLIKNLSS